MATALAAQLATIAANSTNQLDLKAQRRAHSQSLIFEPQDAAVQDFDTVYDVCIGGFRELCLLDSRFSSFAKSIFSEHSKTQERSQMTSAQNEELDVVLERFLHLVGSKILLQPAIQAVEWLVRRFRVHEYNTLCLVFTFLPYHTLPLFATLLSIIPKKLSPATKFLHPYVQSLAAPPRHVIAYAATNNVEFFSAWNKYLLKCCQEKFFSPPMISYWATVMTEAVTGQLDQTASGRREAQRQKEEDVLLRILPVLSKGLAMKSVPDLRVGCYMILSVLASRANLDDKVLLGLIEAVLNGGTKETSHAELICISVLAQQRVNPHLPFPIFKSLMSREGLVDDILTLSGRYLVDKLAFSLATGTLQWREDAKFSSYKKLIQVCARKQLLTDVQVSAFTEHMLAATDKLEPLQGETQPIARHIADCVQEFSMRASSAALLKSALEVKDMNMEQLQSLLQIELTLPASEDPGSHRSTNEEEPIKSEEKVTYSISKANIPENSTIITSFLSHDDTVLFRQLATLFTLAARASSDVDDFIDLPIFKNQKMDRNVLSMTFFGRFACGPFPPASRAQALGCMSRIVKNLEPSSDPQCFLPYAVCSLSDESGLVRRAAIALTLALSRHYDPEKRDPHMETLEKFELYGHSRTEQITWLSHKDAAAFLHRVITPSLEECAIDQSHVSGLLQNALRHSQLAKSSDNQARGLKSSTRASILRFLSSHAVETPSYGVKRTTLRLLGGISKAGGVTKTQTLLPLLSAHLNQSESQFAAVCLEARLDPKRFAEELVEIVSPSERDANELLRQAIAAHPSVLPPAMENAVFRHVSTVWETMKLDIQESWAETLYRIAVLDPQDGQNHRLTEFARDTLSHLLLSSDVLLDFLTKLPRVTEDVEERSPSAKRRKTSRGIDQGRTEASSDDLYGKWEKLVFVLELVEASKDGISLRLMPQLFQILHDLQQCYSRDGNDVSYAQSLTLGSLTRIVKHAIFSGASPVEQQSMRIDIVIDCFRSSSSPQVQHEALVLLSCFASFAPNLIVHSVMPIFTFMGHSVLRQGDDHSARVVNNTIESIIPPLVASFRGRKGGLLGGASELILSFAAAFEHIPSHRRLELLTLLMRRLGEGYLYILLIILVDRHGGKPSIMEFCAKIMAQYRPIVQLQTLSSCIDVASDSLKPEPKKARQVLSADKDKDFRETSKILIDLSLQLLKIPNLSHRVAKILRASEERKMEICDLYSELVEQTLQLTKRAESFNHLLEACGFLLDSLFDFLPLADSSTLLNSLLQSGDEDVRCRVLRSLEQRIEASKSGDADSAQACLELLPRLLRLLEESSNNKLNRATVACIDRVAEKYGKKDIGTVTAAAEALLSAKCLGSDDAQMQILVLLCFVTLIEILKEAMIPMIPSILPRSLELLSGSIKNSNQPLQKACFSLFSSFFLYLPWMITGLSLRQFLELSYDSAHSNTSPESVHVRTSSLGLLANQGNAHECIQVLQSSWNHAVAGGVNSIFEHLDILERVVEKHSKSIVIQEANSLTALFLMIMDLRTFQHVGSTGDQLASEQVEKVEGKRNEIMIKMIYKLNDTHFRPLFIKMSEWATATQNKREKKRGIDRNISWFSFLQHFFETLQSIVTSYSTHVIDQAVDILADYDAFQSSASPLWERVLKTLHAMFEYDQDEFWKSPSRFAAILTPLLSQLKFAAVQDADSYLIPCLTSFATAADSQDHLKVINSKLLEHLRSDDSKVRLAAVRCEMSITESMGEEWLHLLPEMLPAISEAMEDDDEHVENEVRKWARKIEDILGESLDDMLQ